MHLLATLNALLLLASPVDTNEAEIQRAGFSIRVYPYGGGYYYCPPGYGYGPGFSYGYGYGYCYPRYGRRYYYYPYYPYYGYRRRYYGRGWRRRYYGGRHRGADRRRHSSGRRGRGRR